MEFRHGTVDSDSPGEYNVICLTRDLTGSDRDDVADVDDGGSEVALLSQHAGETSFPPRFLSGPMTADASGEAADGERRAATRICLSYRAPAARPDADEWPLAGDEWVREELRGDTFLGYLRRVHAGPVAVGDEFAEFVNCGCGRLTDVVLRVEAVEGGDRLGPDTDLDVRHRSGE